MRRHLLKSCLASLAKQTLAKNLFEVIVVIDHFDECEIDLPLIIENCSTPGINRARNLGLRRARGDLLYFLDDDCRLTQYDFLLKLIQSHQATSATAIGGPYLNDENSKVLQRAYNRIANLWAHSHISNGIGQIPLIGGNMCFKRQAFSDQEFADDIHYGGTETEFHFRLFRSGHVYCFDDSMGVAHLPEMNFPLMMAKAWLQGRGRRYAASKISRAKFKFYLLQLNKMTLREIPIVITYLLTVQLASLRVWRQKTTHLQNSSNAN